MRLASENAALMSAFLPRKPYELYTSSMNNQALLLLLHYALFSRFSRSGGVYSSHMQNDATKEPLSKRRFWWVTVCLYCILVWANTYLPLIATFLAILCGALLQRIYQERVRISKDE